MYIIEGAGLGSLGMTITKSGQLVDSPTGTNGKMPFVSDEAAEEFFQQQGLTQPASTDWTKYIVWGAVGLTALVVLWMAFKK